LKLPIFAARLDQVELGIRICYQEAQNKLRDQKIDLLLAILPDENGDLYGLYGSVVFMTEILKGYVRQISVSCHICLECDSDHIMM